ncbi:MAG: hypothetical protein WCM93_05090 [Bacteroidota bacterium]
MKRIKSIMLIIALVLIPVFMSLAQTEPPHPGQTPENTPAAPVGGVPGGGAPIGDGGTILVMLAVAYGLTKYTRKVVLIKCKSN